MPAVSITVYGKVQGVFFRKFTQQIAKSLDLTGFVKNNSDGSVYIEASGEDEKLKKLVDWCNKGPSAAKVERTDVSSIMPGKYSGFEIRR
jgi:acylphosphatase